MLYALHTVICLCDQHGIKPQLRLHSGSPASEVSCAHVGGSCSYRELVSLRGRVVGAPIGPVAVIGAACGCDAFPYRHAVA